MRLKRMIWTPSAEVVFEASEVEVVAKLSAQHYDYKCKALSQPGGAIYGMQNRVQIELEAGKDGKIVVELDNQTAQLLAKCCERRNRVWLGTMTERNESVTICHLADTLERLINRLNSEWRRANAPRRKKAA